MKDFIIVHMLDPYTLGKPFTIWGYHMTVMQWFEAPSIEKVKNIVQPIASAHTSMKIDVGEVHKFGTKDTHVVSLLPELQLLHDELLSAVEDSGWAVRGRFTGQLFRPHITAKLGKVYSQDSFVLDKLQIAESLPQGYRSIVAEIDLKPA